MPRACLIPKGCNRRRNQMIRPRLLNPSERLAGSPGCRCFCSKVSPCSFLIRRSTLPSIGYVSQISPHSTAQTKIQQYLEDLLSIRTKVLRLRGVISNLIKHIIIQTSPIPRPLGPSFCSQNKAFHSPLQTFQCCALHAQETYTIYIMYTRC